MRLFDRGEILSYCYPKPELHFHKRSVEMDIHLRSYRNRRWLSIALIQIRAKLVATGAFLLFILLLGYCAMLVESCSPGFGHFVWWYGALSGFSLFFSLFSQRWALRKFLRVRLVHNDRQRVRIIQKATRLHDVRVHLFIGEEGPSVGMTLSYGIQGLPITIAISSLSAEVETRQELIAVIAHEYGHAVNDNILTFGVVRAGVSLLIALGLGLGALSPWGKSIPHRWPKLTRMHTGVAYTLGIALLPLSLLLYFGGLGAAFILCYLPAIYDEYAADSQAYAAQGSAVHLSAFLSRLQKAADSSTESPRQYSFFRLLEADRELEQFNLIQWHPPVSDRIRALFRLSGELQ